MKNPFLLLFVLLLTVACDKNNRRINAVNNYYKAFNNSDYNEIKSLITDSITITEGSYVMSYTKKSFNNHFKWDSIFKPTYKVKALKELNDEIIVKIEVNSLRLEFLKNNPMTCEYKISFESDKLTKFENLDCIGVNWAIWEKERDSLIDWISTHHSELDGFIHDLTISGAKNYLKAISLYENNKKAL